MSEVMDKLDELEKRVAQLKDWKQKYEQGKINWDKDKKELDEVVASLRKLGEALWSILAPYLIPSQTVTPRQTDSLNLNLEETQLTVSVAHQDKEVNMTTGTVIGKVLFCALTELLKDGFSESELSEILKEHGWNVGHSTLAPTLGNLVRDGYLVRLAGKPARYRLPAKVKLNVREEDRKEKKKDEKQIGDR